MIEIIREFIVKPETRGQFELTYGPGGAWCKLFAGYPGYRGTTLLRETENTERYLTIDFWDTIAQREQLLAERKTEYSSLETAFTDWTNSQTEVGIFRARAEATVHPRSRARRNRAEPTRRGSR